MLCGWFGCMPVPGNPVIRTLLTKSGLLGSIHDFTFYISFLCISECPLGRYGFDCLIHCSCANSSLCNPKTGRCECEPGRTGSDCRQGQR